MKSFSLLLSPFFGYLPLVPTPKQAFLFYDKDLSNSLINYIYQDKRDYIWIATEDGLNKFDGVKFSIYKNDLNDSTSLKNNYVRCMYEDSKEDFG